jgi:SAM-dependent methyltransferase
MVDARKLLKLLRRITRRGRQGHRPPDRWWDTVYGQYGAYAASGDPGVPEVANQRDFAVRWALLEELLRRYGGPGRSRLLDAGCGNGLFTKRFVDLGYDVTATDFSPKALEQARARAGDAATWVQAPLEEFRAPRPFDLIVCTGVLMCITEDARHAQAFHNLTAHLAPGGHLLIEELLVPLEEMGPEPPPGKRVRFRALEVYSQLCGETRLAMLEHIPFDLPGAGHTRCFLVLGATDAASPAKPHVKEAV